MLKLYKHQCDLISTDPVKTGIWWGTGSAKTITALYLARGRTLVICPKTIRDDDTWPRNLKKAGIKLNMKVLSKEEFRRDWDSLPAFDTVIVDEFHAMCGVTPNIVWRKKVAYPKASQLFEALDQFIHKHKPTRFYGLTATIIKSPFTVWGAAKLLGTYLDFYQFRAEYYQRLSMPGREVYQAKSGPEVKRKLAALVQQIGVVGRLEDFTDMPEQSFKTDYVELTAEQTKRLKDIPLEFPDPLVGALKKHMVENGVLSGDEFNAPEEFKNQKVDRILDYANEFPQLVVFARYKAQIAQIASALESEGHNVLILTGDTKDRGSVILAANTMKEYVLICQSQLTSGWEVPNCPTVIFASLDFSIVNLIQAQGRISRINNPKRNLYIYLVAGRGSVDERVYKTVVETKMDFHLAQFDKSSHPVL